MGQQTGITTQVVLHETGWRRFGARSREGYGEIFQELAAVGSPVEEEDKVVHLLASLPESIDTLGTALEAHVEVPKMDAVIERMLHEEKKKSDQVEGIEAGLISKRHRGPKCYNCSNYGHIKRDCPQKK